MRLKSKTNILVQLLGIITHAAAMAGDILPANTNETAMIVAASAQALSGIIAHYRNPDGTPAAVAYIPEVKAK